MYISNNNEVRGGKDLPDAFNDMCERYFVPNLPERSTIRHDVWRIRRLYTLENKLENLEEYLATPGTYNLALEPKELNTVGGRSTASSSSSVASSLSSHQIHRSLQMRVQQLSGLPYYTNIFWTNIEKLFHCLQRFFPNIIKQQYNIRTIVHTLKLFYNCIVTLFICLVFV